MRQPPNRGVITTVKALSKKCICERALPSVQQHKPLKMNIRGAINMVVGSWWQVKATTISKCFKKAGFVHNGEAFEAVEQSDFVDEIVNADDVWSSLVDSNFASATDSFQDYVDDGENGLVVCKDLSMDDAIVAVVRSAVLATEDWSV